jgi:anti-anti-sigma factor
MLVEIENQNDVCILRLRGRFMTGADPGYLRSRADEVRASNYSKLLVDVSEVDAIGSTVIGFVVALYTSIVKKAGGRFSLTGANKRVREVLDITRLDTIIPLAPDAGSVLALWCGGDSAARAAGR